jgi:hypothetical protein
MTLSAVAGILDQKGGLRVVVTQRWRMRHHVKKGERLFVVPDLLVQEPVPWNDIPATIASVHRHVNKTLSPENLCGTCIACCRVPFIRHDANAGGGACVNCTGDGCAVYFNRPKPCRDFSCHWHASQSRNDKMPDDMRPDRCGVLFTPDTINHDPLVFEVHVNPQRPEAEHNTNVRRYIDEMQAAGYKAKLITHYLPDPTDLP